MRKFFQGAWVAQSAEQPALGFCPGHGLRIMRSTPGSSSALSGGSAQGALSPLPLPPPHSYACALSLSQTNIS